MDVEQLRTLACVVDAGAFDRAGQELGVSTSAVSQRIKALEREVGAVVVERTAPVRPTEGGQQLLRFARQVVELHKDTLTAMGASIPGRSCVKVAVNADSLATWFTGVVCAAAGEDWENVELQLFVEDQEHSRDLLHAGEVQAAVTTSKVPVSGCHCVPLGSMEYRPMIHPKLLERFSVNGALDLRRCPVVIYNRKDDVQHIQLRRLGITSEPPVNSVPSSEGFVRAVRAGLGWGMVPTLQLRPQEGEAQAQAGSRSGETLVDLTGIAGLEPLRVPLYLQRWSVRTAELERLERAVLEAWAGAYPGKR